MVQVQRLDGTYVECVPNAPVIGSLMRAGATMYRGNGVIYIVPIGQNHHAAWQRAKDDAMNH